MFKFSEKKILSVVGARPNFVKMAPLIEAINKINRINKRRLFHSFLVHTGQHYDPKMSDSFFLDLKIPVPDIFLGVGSGSHADQTAKIMVAFEKACVQVKPDLVLVVGDVNSTLACSLVASKLGIPVAHVEAGLRSFDRTMPEEINRLVTDAVSDFLFVSEESGVQNLLNEGKKKDQIYFVGNVMIDTLNKYRKKASQSHLLREIKLVRNSYGVITLHRPSNVDRIELFHSILGSVVELSKRIPIIFPVHPRTRQQIEKWDLSKVFLSPPVKGSGLYWLGPVGYLDFLGLMDNAKIVLTDSGGIQEETTALGVPCLTLRQNTERPVTTTVGTNQLVGTDRDKIINAGMEIIENSLSDRKIRIPEFWDGKTAERIVNTLGGIFNLEASND